MDIKQGNIKEKTLGLDSSVINMVVLILTLNAIGSTTYFIWQSVIEVAPDSNRTVVLILADLFFAYNLYKGKLWAKKWIIVRSVIGCIIWAGMSLYQHDIFGAISNIVFLGAIVALLSGKVKQAKARLVGFIAIGLLVYLSYQNIDAIRYHQNTTKQMNEIGQNSYISSKYGYSVKAPDNWKIIRREDFGKIEKSFLDTDAEIILITSDDRGCSLLIPEVLEGYGVDYNLEGLRNTLLEEIKSDNSTEILESKFTTIYGDGGFEIKYSSWDGGFRYNYLVLYTIYNTTGINLLTWALASDSEEIFKDVKGMLSELKAGK